ncbi:hypothetical protein P7C71_g3798, partial [Lecanoromycetidae sp. Uapishka_2]
MVYQIAVFFVIEDTWHYWSHRALHWGPLYKNIHKIHHQYSAPFGMAAEYASPIEVMILGLGAEHHDVHHERFIGNYSSSFRWWDYILDTESGPEAAKKRRQRKLAKEGKKI